MHMCSIIVISYEKAANLINVHVYQWKFGSITTNCNIIKMIIEGPYPQIVNAYIHTLGCIWVGHRWAFAHLATYIPTHSPRPLNIYQPSLNLAPISRLKYSTEWNIISTCL